MKREIQKIRGENNMYLLLNGSKGSHDRKIDIILSDIFSNAEMAGDKLKSILIDWLLMELKDDELLEKLQYDYEEYNKKMRTKIKSKITKAINNNDGFIMYDCYDGYEINYDKDGNLTMITTGCPSDNEYNGETYQVIYI